jgi:hypothetical protein
MSKTPEQRLKQAVPTMRRGLFQPSPAFAAGNAIAVRQRHMTQDALRRSALTRWRPVLCLSAIHDFRHDASPVDVHIVTQESQ